MRRGDGDGRWPSPLHFSTSNVDAAQSLAQKKTLRAAKTTEGSGHVRGAQGKLEVEQA
jgi:hypothetical protein